MKKFLLISALAALTLFSGIQNALAQDALNAFLDQVLTASRLPTCEETQKALSQISESSYQNASNEIKTLNNQGVLNNFKEKISEINRLTSHCPEVQDSFVQKLSRLGLKASIDAKSGASDSSEFLKYILSFTEYADAALKSPDCEAATQSMRKIPRQTCDNAIHAFQTLDPNTLADAQYREVSDKIQSIITRSASCPDFRQAYHTCLTPTTVKYRDSAELQPLLNWINAIENALRTTSCDKLDQITIDQELENRVQSAYANIRPSEYSPEALKKLHDATLKAREAGKNCPAAELYLQNRIDKLFAH